MRASPRGLWVACWVFAGFASGCASAPSRGREEPSELERSLARAAERLVEVRGEEARLARLPRIERWDRARLRRELDARWSREWPQAEAEGALLQALGLWPAGEDYRGALLEAVAADTDALYLQDEHRIAVTSEPVAESTLIHELVHALQRERWGVLSPPRTLAEAYARSAQLEGEASLTAALAEARGAEEPAPAERVSEALAGWGRRAEAALAVGLRGDARRPAWRWLWVEPSLQGAVWALEAYARRGWRAFAARPRAGPDLAPGVESLGPRGWAWLRETWGLWRVLPEGDWLVSDRLERGPASLTWTLACRDEAAAEVVARALRGARVPRDAQASGVEVRVTCPLASGR